jgi:acetyl/propionyl-CoA carboxylase alpha subunit
MARTFVAQLEDRHLPIEVEETGPHRYAVRINGELREVDGRIVGPNRLSFLVEGRNYEASIIRGGDEVDVLIGSHRFRFRMLPEERARRAQAAGATDTHGRREIKASMPGKVIDVLVQIGDAVEPHHGLLIIEAMKMENEIRSPGAGEVKEIRVKPGQAVEAGEILAVVE